MVSVDLQPLPVLVPVQGFPDQLNAANPSKEGGESCWSVAIALDLDIPECPHVALAQPVALSLVFPLLINEGLLLVLRERTLLALKPRPPFLGSCA